MKGYDDRTHRYARGRPRMIAALLLFCAQHAWAGDGTEGGDLDGGDRSTAVLQAHSGEARHGRARGARTTVHVSIPPPGPRPLTIASTLDAPDSRLRLPASAFDDRLVAHLFQGRVRILNDSLTSRITDLYLVQTPHLEPRGQGRPEHPGGPHCFAIPAPTPDVRVEVACDDGAVHGLLGTWGALANVITLETASLGEGPREGTRLVFEDDAVRLFALDAPPDPLLVFAGDEHDPSRSSARTEAGYRFFWVDMDSVEKELRLEGATRVCADFLVPAGGYGGGFTRLGVPGARVILWLTVPRGSRVVHVLSPPGDPIAVRVSTEFAAVSYHDSDRRALFVDNDTVRPVTGRMCLVRTTGDSAIAGEVPSRLPLSRFFDPFPPQAPSGVDVSHALRDPGLEERPTTLASNLEVLTPGGNAVAHLLDTPSPTTDSHGGHVVGPSGSLTRGTEQHTETSEYLATPPGHPESTPAVAPPGTSPDRDPATSLRNPVVAGGAASPAAETPPRTGRSTSRPRPYGPAGNRAASDTAATGGVEVAYVQLEARPAPDSPGLLSDKLSALARETSGLSEGQDTTQTFLIDTGDTGLTHIRLTVTRLEHGRYSLLATSRDGAGHWTILDVRTIFGAPASGHEAEDMERTTVRPVLDAWRVLEAATPGTHLSFPAFLRPDLAAQLADDLQPLIAKIPRAVMASGQTGVSCHVLVLDDDKATVRLLSARVRYLGLRDYEYFKVTLEDDTGSVVDSVETWRPKKDLLERVNARAGTTLTREDFP